MADTIKKLDTEHGKQWHFMLLCSLLFWSNPSIAHDGHSHGPSQSSTRGGGADQASKENPFLLSLSLRAGYQANPYTGILPGVGFFIGNEEFSFSPSYRFKFRQFLAGNEKTELRERGQDQDIDHEVQGLLKKKLTELSSFNIQGRYQKVTSRLPNSSLSDVNSFSAHSFLSWQASRRYSFDFGHEAESRSYPNGTLTIPPIGGMSGSGESIYPESPFTESAVKNEVVNGVQDTEQSLYAAMNVKLARISFGGQTRAIFNRSNSAERAYDGFRITVRLERALWAGGLGNLEHQFEKRDFENNDDRLNTTEANVSHQLSKSLKVAALTRMNSVQSQKSPVWEGYLELRSIF